jgi:hypothetical protein
MIIIASDAQGRELARVDTRTATLLPGVAAELEAEQMELHERVRLGLRGTLALLEEQAREARETARASEAEIRRIREAVAAGRWYELEGAIGDGPASALLSELELSDRSAYLGAEPLA